jgi:hypothetical protein
MGAASPIEITTEIPELRAAGRSKASADRDFELH